MKHVTIGQRGAANWVFIPGANTTCIFEIFIPNSKGITEHRATYQAWETLPDDHTDQYRLPATATEDNATEDQAGHRGGTISISFGPTKTGTMDLQLFDDNPDGTSEVAGMVTADCH